MSFIILIVGVLLFLVVFSRISAVSEEVRVLRSDVVKLAKMYQDVLKSGPVQSATVVNGVNASTNQSTSQASTSSQNTEQNISKPTNSDIGSRFMNWLKENWLLKLGVAMILIAFGWFISYAFVHNWIGPIGRVTLGFAVGSVLAIVGTLRMQKNEVQGTTFLILGSALVVITSFASQVVYNFFSPMVALSIPFIVGLFVATVGATYNKMNIGIYAVVIGFLAPILTHVDSLDQNLLFIYLAVVTLSCVWVAIRKNWRIINVLSLAGMFAYSLNFVTSSVDNNFILTLLYVLTFGYFFISMMGIIMSKEDVSQSDVFVAVVNSLLIITLTLSKVLEEYQSLVCAFWMIVFAFGSLFVFLKTKKTTFFYIYSLIAVALLAVATSVELEGHALIFAFAIESAVVSIASYLVTKNSSVGLKMSMFTIVPALMALPSFSAYSWKIGVFNEDFFVIFFVGIIFMVLGLLYYFVSSQDTQLQKENAGLYAAHIIIGSCYLLGLIWTALHSGFENRSTAVTLSLIIYSIIGIITYFKGSFSGKKVFKYYGGTLLVLVVLRLIFVDVWRMPLASRIVVFVLIGILFISTAFITKRKADQLLSK